MDAINEIKKSVRHENWKRTYEKYQSSGMTVKDWCKAQGISVKTFYYCLRVLRENLTIGTNTHCKRAFFVKTLPLQASLSSHQHSAPTHD